MRAQAFVSLQDLEEVRGGIEALSVTLPSPGARQLLEELLDLLDGRADTIARESARRPEPGSAA